MLVSSLKHNQKIKALDSLHQFNEDLVVYDEDYGVLVTGEQLQKGFICIAEAGDIGRWDKCDKMIYFSKINKDGQEIENGVDCSIQTNLSNCIFEVLDEYF